VRTAGISGKTVTKAHELSRTAGFNATLRLSRRRFRPSFQIFGFSRFTRYETKKNALIRELAVVYLYLVAKAGRYAY
jgi:hypothetical protein